MNPDRALVSVANRLEIKSLRTDHAERSRLHGSARHPGCWSP